mgnify:FL=1
MKRGIAFSGGGLRGAYQVGAYKAFLDAHKKIDGFVGTSIGSFNAAMCASDNFKKLYNFWYNDDLGKILGFSEKLVNKSNNNDYDLEMLNEILNNIKSIVVNKGISTINLKKKLEEFNIGSDLYTSNKDFGLVTVRFNDFKPIYLFKEEIPKNKLNEYIIASCFLPVFKFEKMIDDSYYLDGGFHDYIPANSLLEKGYDQVYVVDLEAIGIKRPYIDKKKVVVIKPSRKLGSILDFKKNDIRNNIKMGYYDTLRVLKEFDGKKYIFKKCGLWYYEYLLKSVNNKEKEEMMKFFGTKNAKRLVIKALEFVMKKENFTYFNIYKAKDVIKRIKYVNKDYGVYKFVKNMNV